MSAIGTGSPSNKVVAHWARKLHNRKLRWLAFLDSGATSGAAPEEDELDLVNTGQPSRKTLMFPDGRTGKVTNKMLLKHNLRVAAREMNIVPGLHSALVSIPKLADAGYTTVFNKNGAAIYDTINVIFVWYHATAGFPTKATFIDTVRNGNYSTWPKLTVTLINRYFPDSDETIKGHLKGQHQGIRLTKQVALEKIIENEELRIKIEGEGSPFHQTPISKTHEAFFRVEELTDSIHTDQTGAFPVTSQRGNRYIMVAIHLDANYIFVKPMRNRTKEEMIRAYE
jgi:hypothetical protein